MVFCIFVGAGGGALHFVPLFVCSSSSDALPTTAAAAGGGGGRRRREEGAALGEDEDEDEEEDEEGRSGGGQFLKGTSPNGRMPLSLANSRPFYRTTLDIIGFLLESRKHHWPGRPERDRRPTANR